MDEEIRFFRCSNCGNIIIKLHDSSVGVVCCGERMTELKPGTSDGAGEKHVPCVQVGGNHVNIEIGETRHPMIDSHYIEFIAIRTNYGIHIKMLKPGAPPTAHFVLDEGEKLLTTYEYCNVHGLWKA